MNFGTVAAPVLFDEGETFYVQWRQLFSQGYTDTNRAGIGGTKTAIICAGDIDGSADAQGNGRENSTACEISQIVLNGGDCFTAHLVNPELVPFGFHRCPADGGTINFEFTISTPFGNAFNVQNARPNYCLRHTNAFYPSRLNPNQTPNPGTCLTIYPSEWMTHKFAITLGPWGLVRQLIPTGGGTPINQYGFQNSRIRFWLGRPGQVSEPVWDFTMGLGTSYVSDFHRGYGKIWFTPRGGGEPVTHPEYYSWYDEVIVSRNDIAEPL
jgi:hypothetical protein